MALAVHFDPYAGFSATAALGALLDAGLSLEALCAQLARLPLPGWRIVVDEDTHAGIAGTRVAIQRKGDAASWSLAEAVRLLKESGLDGEVREQGSALLTRLAALPDVTSANNEGRTLALETIVACIGVVLGLRLLGATVVTVTPPPWGAPGVPPAAEAVALLTTLATVRPAALRLRQIGYGFADAGAGGLQPPAVRVRIGAPDAAASGWPLASDAGAGEVPASTLLLLLHHAAEAGPMHERLAALAAAWTGGPVQLCAFAGGTEKVGPPSLTAALEGCIAAGARRVVVQPLDLLANPAHDAAVVGVIDWARGRWPTCRVLLATPLLGGMQIASRLAQRAEESVAPAATASSGHALTAIPAAEVAVVLIAPGRAEPEANAEACRIARLVWDGRAWGWVEAAFIDGAVPTVAEVFDRCRRLGARGVIAVPLVPIDGPVSNLIATRVRVASATQPDLPVSLARPLGLPEGLAVVSWERYREALDGSGGARGHGHSHGSAGVLRPILPPRYRGDATVSSAPMGAAPLAYDAAGRVAWEAIWGDFCELAIAGGPPHRGTLLEPAAPEEVRARPDEYARVLDELARGLRLVTDWPVKRDAAPGWIGLVCPDDEAAIWLLRAILTENVTARREEATLFLPAGPAFSLAAEIKNVVTVVAKTHHYWTEHMAEGGGAATPLPTPAPPEPPETTAQRGRLPRYDYECASCQTRFDVARQPEVAGTPAPCPFCGAPARRIFTSPKLLFKADPRDTKPVWHGHGAYGHAHAPGKGFHGRGGTGQGQ